MGTDFLSHINGAVHSRMYTILRVWLIVIAIISEFLLMIPKILCRGVARNFDSGLFVIFFPILAMLLIFANVNFGQGSICHSLH